MKPRALVVSTANPYPVVTNGCARLVSDYQTSMFLEHDVFFLLTRPGDWAPVTLFHGSTPVDGDVDVTGLLARDFSFILFIGFKESEFTRHLAASRPSFCLTDTYPHPDLPDGMFCGILTHRASTQSGDLLLVSGAYDDAVFRPEGGREELVVAVGRIHPDKNQLDLVRGYRDTIYEKYGLPLHLVGGVDDADYFRELEPHLDGAAVVSTVDPACPSGAASWRSAGEIADLCHRARLFVSASPKESFGMAMIEAMACGTTCVVNGDYWGFSEEELRPNVLGNITGPHGSTVDLVREVLANDVRIDGSQWATRYSIGAVRDAVVGFIDAHL